MKEEYKIDENGYFAGKENERISDDYMSTYFIKSASSEKKYTPRAILVDLDRTVLNVIKHSKLKNYFDTKNFVYPNSILAF